MPGMFLGLSYHVHSLNADCCSFFFPVSDVISYGIVLRAPSAGAVRMISGRYNQVATAPGFHLFPSRTEKLSPGAPMVLHRNVGE